ncbi:uncharacterized protein LOC122849273 [Aphidius gifuensis]|uniref:uncharacterized protein LOC122849273 n=1 Tax=Aphidius gifuensis TaxID=684658 RepID=UPI001CDC8EF2|nr:uncharacterized protein LOC122849273 [Aphidius gifuensis]
MHRSMKKGRYRQYCERYSNTDVPERTRRRLLAKNRERQLNDSDSDNLDDENEKQIEAHLVKNNSFSLRDISILPTSCASTSELSIENNLYEAIKNITSSNIDHFDHSSFVDDTNLHHENSFFQDGIENQMNISTNHFIIPEDSESDASITEDHEIENPSSESSTDEELLDIEQNNKDAANMEMDISGFQRNHSNYSKEILIRTLLVLVS